LGQKSLRGDDRGRARGETFASARSAESGYFYDAVRAGIGGRERGIAREG
jgi:hypothetical protein